VILRHYKQALTALPFAQPWVLFYAEANVTGALQEQLRRQQQHGLPVCVWGDADIARVFPQIAHSLLISNQSGTIDLERRERLPHYLALYHFFHSSLLVWNATHGHAYPAARYFWRLEIDVLYSDVGSLATMIQRPMRSSHAHFDLLLPDVTMRNENLTMMGGHARNADDSYPHWLLAEGKGTNGRHSKMELAPQEDILSQVPRHLQAYALVCVGRFSSIFLRDIMGPLWHRGTIGYEEILLPTTCFQNDDCTLAPFGSRAKIGVKHIRFRPSFACQEFLEARRANTSELWHPIKNRTCFAEALLREEGGR